MARIAWLKRPWWQSLTGWGLRINLWWAFYLGIMILPPKVARLLAYDWVYRQFVVPRWPEVAWVSWVLWVEGECR
ncbi:hypothetical protein TPY_3204 [Sulfobacillus acidophilus TPY]|uniref:Uncharacterized protein n=1 Tax=Sulfobacillus acidophilus (strain ATCC 700253 / DSM 10332 / NAL) TaxID=679936 RepID=G8TZG5_SULAD|nr:hypothetical protein TPY_3204 [Sulfobacillus acidophilus TPY]AEW05205.1 hypothetical protein Sulac_1709 [Sulfobacillus acidophilus DSM 10332]